MAPGVGRDPVRAIVYDRYGGPEVLRLDEVPKPTAAPGRLLIEVVSASVNRSDWEGLTARPVYVRMSGAGMFRPKQRILGSDLAGRIAAVGDEVDGWQPGDAVFGDVLYHGAACFAQFILVRMLLPVPAGVVAALTAERRLGHLRHGPRTTPRVLPR